MVTARKLRRLRATPTAVKVGAGVLAGAVGMTTAAYGVLLVMHPYKGNGARSDVRPANEEPPLEQQLTDLVLALVPTEAPPAEGGEQPSFMVDNSGQLVTTVVDAVNGSANTVVGGGSSDGTGNTGNTGNNGGSGSGLLGNLGNGGGGEGGNWTPPGGEGGGQGINVPNVGGLTPPVTLPDATLGEEEDPCAAEETESSDPALIDPSLSGGSGEAEEEPVCEEAPAGEEEPPAEEQAETPVRNR